MPKRKKHVLTQKQWQWISNFHLEFGFEVMYLDEFVSGENSWRLFVLQNLQWITDNTQERLESLKDKAGI